MSTARKRANKLPSGEEIERLQTRAEASGCDRCGTRFAELLPYFICRTTAYAFSVRCENCSSLSAEPVFVGLYYGGGDPWSADDRAWFARQPNRKWRLRQPYPGELSPAALGCDEGAADQMDAFIGKALEQGLVVAIATHQAEIGKRLRRVVAVPTRDPLESFTDRGIAVLIPGIDERTIASIPNNELDWETAHREKMEERWNVFLRGSTS